MRNIKLLHIYYISVFILLFFPSCEQDIEFQYEKKSITSESFEMCSSQECPYIEVRYLTFKTPQLLEEPVSQWIFKTIASSLNQENTTSQNLDDLLQTFINNAQTGYPETITLSDTHEFSAEVEMLYTSNDIVSIRYYADIFDGGAHGFYQEFFANFDPKTGQFFQFTDILNEDFYAFAKARLSQSYPNEVFVISPDSFTDTILQIGFDKEGMILLYKDPAIFPPAENDYRISIPLSDADDYLNF